MRCLLNRTLPAWALATVMTAPMAAPQVVCHVTYGGETVDHLSASVASPYEAEPVAVGSYFLFRTALQTGPRGLAAFKVYTYADRGDAPVLIHQQSVAWPPPKPRPGRPGGFTGLHWVYEPVRDGELQYWCERAPPSTQRPAGSTK